MRPVAPFVLGGVFLAGAAMAQAPEGDRDAGRKLAGQCRTCHGLDGFAKIPIAPHIGGEPASYIVSQLTAFRDGTRQNEMMTVVTKSLTDAQIADLAAWYAGHEAVAELTADPDDAPEVCAGCHGVDGISVVEDAPNLAGETTIYTDTQLKAFRFDKRTHEVMSPIAKDLSDDEVRAVAEWYAAIGLTITQVD